MAEARWHYGRALSALRVIGTLDPNLQLTKVQIHRPCGPSSSPLLAMASAFFAEAH
jgi:hypothetical protein